MKLYKTKVNGKIYEVEVESVTESKDSIKTSETSKMVPEKPITGSTIKAPMQGTIIKTQAKVGTRVSKGHVLFVLEAMKLESEILSPIDGVIQELYVKVGQKVDANQPLLIIG